MIHTSRVGRERVGAKSWGAHACLLTEAHGEGSLAKVCESGRGSWRKGLTRVEGTTAGEVPRCWRRSQTGLSPARHSGRCLCPLPHVTTCSCPGSLVAESAEEVLC